LVQACSLGRYRREFKSLQPHQIDILGVVGFGPVQISMN